MRIKLLILFLVLASFIMVSCDIYAGISSRQYWFDSLDRLYEIMDSMNFNSGHSYVFTDLESNTFFVDSGYSFTTRYVGTDEPLKQADKIPPTLSLAFKPSNEAYDAVILYVVAREIEDESNFDIEYQTENAMWADFSVNEEINTKLESTVIRPFVLELGDRIISNEYSPPKSYSFYLADDPDNYLFHLTFFYSSSATNPDEDFENAIIAIMLTSVVLYTT